MKYTAGELAKKLGVSARTVRFYDEKELLPPCGYSEAGYRLYNDDSAERLQKIIMLRFLDFSIEQIQKIMQEESFDVKTSLKEQEELLLEKKEHIERIIAAVRDTQNASDEQLWEHMRHIIDITKEREDVTRQYNKEENLKKRISIHDYSTASVKFYPWMLDKIELEPDMKILDIGCGNAAFWKYVAPKLPRGLEIHLVDYSAGMLESAAKNVAEIQGAYPEKQLKFVLDKRDATAFSYPVSGFHRIMANHMLYHINKESRLDLYQKINALLAETGRFSCSLIGRKHMQE
ncbi:MAG: MerR family transcriptional regulator, partial [Lachnospiraceae bacterium]|nr:MerR family transcriptional regulator [Lachnospiraceae bacterium]